MKDRNDEDDLRVWRTIRDTVLICSVAVVILIVAILAGLGLIQF